MSETKRSLYLTLIGPGVALLAAGARLAVQGSVKLYTEPDKQFYFPDPDLGWRLGGDSYHWLGLDRIAAIVGVGGFLLVAAFLVQRRERRREVRANKLRVALWALSPLALLVPTLAFLGGTPADGARAEAPAIGEVETAGFAASLPGAPAGVYRVLPHEGSLIAAAIKAGGDEFEARFADDLSGSWRGDPGKLDAAMTGEVTVKAKSVKTGIDLRDRHAGESLKVEEFPELAFRLTRMTGTKRGDASNKIQFTGEGVVDILGKPISTTVTGTVTELDEAGKARLELGTPAALVVNASMSIRISETPIDAGDTFDTDEVPIRVSLVLIHQEAPKEAPKEAP